jgi:3'-phosphoadenosine 5'-phosphosulfate sulfotransferase (PAPS reductase)/FAD synthetase
MQILPLEEKVRATARRIEEWLGRFPDARISFSGGKDSTVLLHIARMVKSDIKAVFADTGLEYPEIREFVLQTENIETVRPKKSFLEVIRDYGYPLVSKRMAQTHPQIFKYCMDGPLGLRDILRRVYGMEMPTL